MLLRPGLWRCLLLAAVGCATQQPPAKLTGARSVSSSANDEANPAETPVVIECPPDMALIPGGSFAMGSEQGQDFERPVHQVTLTTYCLDLDEITGGEYQICVEAAACPEPGPERHPDVRGGLCWKAAELDPKLPRDCVTVEQAIAYCSWERKRLPTEAEWEYAARGGDAGLLYPNGNEPPTKERSCVARSDGACVPRSFPPEAFGLYDLSGNVTEWVADTFAPYTSEPQTNPLELRAGDFVVARGGSYRGRHVTRGRTWVREVVPRDAWPSIGFRCAWSP